MVTKDVTPQVAPKALTGRYTYGTGRRKTSVARVRLYEKGKGNVVINNKEVDAHPIYLAPMTLVGEEGKWNLSIRVRGGGKQSQLEAIRLGVARALLAENADWRQALKKAGFLTRDPREKERMKPGLKRARRAPQWAKR